MNESILVKFMETYLKKDQHQPFIIFEMTRIRKELSETEKRKERLTNEYDSLKELLK